MTLILILLSMAWGGMEDDLASGSEVEVTPLNFMPDNLTWTPDGRILAAGIEGFGGGGFGVAEIDPDSLEATSVYAAGDGPAAITGVSVALQVRDSIYVGSFQGDRLVRISR